MDIPKEVFPENKLDPTVDKNVAMSVEQTMGVVNHLKVVTRKRRQNWRYLVQADGTAAAVRKFYELPENAPVIQQGNEWAAWAGTGEPDVEPFDPVEVVPEETTATVLAEVLANAPPGTVTEMWDPRTATEKMNADKTALKEAAARMAAYERARAGRIGKPDVSKETWAYSTNLPPTAEAIEAMRERYGASADAPIEQHPDGDIVAIWLGKGAPPRSAFPEVQRAPAGLLRIPDTGTVTVHSFPVEGEGPFPANTNPVPGVIGALLQDARDARDAKANGGNGNVTTPAPAPAMTEPPPDLPKKVKIIVPETTLHDMALRLYGMSQESCFNEPLRKFLLHVSDSLHAEAGKLEVAKVRSNFNQRYGAK
jgi:hypothetical protein